MASPHSDESVVIKDPIWLASWPRSGNTLLRIILYNCFGIQSSCLYKNDLDCEFTSASSVYVKTHDKPQDDRPAIYVVRDGREACVSYSHFMRDCPSLRYTIEGPSSTWFGSWSEHLKAWNPMERPQTLLLPYEEMVADPGGAVAKIAGFLELEPTGNELPTFEELHKQSPIMFRAGTNETWKIEMTGSDLDYFYELHGETMEKYGYASRQVKTSSGGAN